MSEYETDPQPQPAAPGTGPVPPTAELPQADGVRPGTAPPIESPVGVPQGAAPAAPPASPAPAPPPASSAAVPPAPAPSPAAAQSAGHLPPGPGHPYAPPAQPGYPYAAGQSHPGYAPQPGHPGQPYAGQPYAVPVPAQQAHLGGGPLPPGWPSPMMAPPAAAAPAPRPGRLGRFVAAGATVLVLMAGSGIAGGVVALAIDGGSGPGSRTYAAAPIINQADLPAIAASVQDSVVSITTGAGEGSGVVLTADGYILTNNHVVASGERRTVEVAFANGGTARAKIVGTDPKTDLAVVRAEGVSDLAPARLGDSDAMQVGDTVLALGSPLGLQGSVTAGIISAKDRTIRAGGDEARRHGAVSISGLLQTDAPINPGNSGGALVNTRGEVIGINTAIATSGQGNGNIGLGFAIPSNKAKAVAETLKKGEKVSHPSLGVGVGDAEGGGGLVVSVVADSPAAAAGLKEGDVVTRFGDKVINSSEDLVAAVQASRVGEQVELTYSRNGVEKKATVTLAEAS